MSENTKKKQNESYALGSAVNKQRARLGAVSETFDAILRFLQMSTSSLLTVKDAIMLIKVRFLYDKVARRSNQVFPKSIRLMFFKALYSLERLQNKYLTLTTITHINLHSKRNLSYLNQVKTKISELYFVALCQQSSGNNSNGGNSTISAAHSGIIGVGDSSMTKWTENDKEVDIC